ncbi:MAG: GntR family transcriptional regulator [Phycisphaerales bacterium]|jgi:DNA-binding LacI/PurR family transcriptional regulator|nr:GntR family transcriptional regulator [Phycisphaerales bacterium]
MSYEGASTVLSELKLDTSSSERLHLQLQRQIREKIQAHRLPPGEKLPTNHEISATLSVSYETVQRAMKALADRGLVVRHKSKGTFVRKAVMPRVVAVYCTDSVFDPKASPFSSLMAHHLSNLLHEDARDMRVHYAPEPWGNKTKGYADMRRDLEERRVAGVITLNRMPRELVDLAYAMSIPVVGVTVPHAADNVVWVDYVDFTHRAIRRMVKEGCRRVVLIGYSLDIEGTHLEDLFKIAEANGLKVVAEDVKCPIGDDWIERGLQMGRQLDLSKYDGAIVADDIIAVGFTRALARRGVRVPEDLRVITMWNRGSPLALALPAVRFDVNIEEMARQSVRMLDQMIEGRAVVLPRLLLKLEESLEHVEHI